MKIKCLVLLTLALIGCVQAPRRDLYRDSPLRFEDVAEEVIARISNGCGSAGTEAVPEFVFRSSCDRHDFYYWMGGTEEDRQRADKQFLEDMRADAWATATLWERSAYLTAAFNYYLAVRKWGKLSFHYTTQPRSWNDLP